MSCLTSGAPTDRPKQVGYTGKTSNVNITITFTMRITNMPITFCPSPKFNHTYGAGRRTSIKLKGPNLGLGHRADAPGLLFQASAAKPSQNMSEARRKSDTKPQNYNVQNGVMSG